MNVFHYRRVVNLASRSYLNPFKMLGKVSMLREFFFEFRDIICSINHLFSELRVKIERSSLKVAVTTTKKTSCRRIHGEGEVICINAVLFS